jgi:hypothetical protein
MLHQYSLRYTICCYNSSQNNDYDAGWMALQHKQHNFLFSSRLALEHVLPPVQQIQRYRWCSMRLAADLHLVLSLTTSSTSTTRHTSHGVGKNSAFLQVRLQCTSTEQGLNVRKSQCAHIQMFTYTVIGTKLTFPYIGQQMPECRVQ